MRTKFKNKLKKSMIRDEIKNKIQLETINVNKTIANKRRGIESKEKINCRAGMNFCIASTQSEEEKEGTERNKTKAISG
jgi:hypothetical protein